MAANHGAGVGILGESVIALPPRAAGGGVGHSPQARDQVLFGQLLIDVLVPFLTPLDLAGLARTCKAGAAAVYDEDGRSVAVSLSLHRTRTERQGRHPGPLITSSTACYVDLSALRFVRIISEVDDNTIFQIQQTLGAKLEAFSFEIKKSVDVPEGAAGPGWAGGRNRMRMSEAEENRIRMHIWSAEENRILEAERIRAEAERTLAETILGGRLFGGLEAQGFQMRMETEDGQQLYGFWFFRILMSVYLKYDHFMLFRRNIFVRSPSCVIWVAHMHYACMFYRISVLSLLR